MDKMTIEGKSIENTETYVFRLEPYGVHVDMTICEETGYIKIDSCYGQYMFSWPSFKNRGNESLKHFLFKRQGKYVFDYVMNKFSYGRREEFRVFKVGETIERFKEEILEIRKRGDSTEEIARDMWESLNELEEIDNIGHFIQVFLENDDLKEWFCEPWEYCVCGLTHHQELVKDKVLPLIAEWMRANVDFNLNCEEANEKCRQSIC